MRYAATTEPAIRLIELASPGNAKKRKPTAQATTPDKPHRSTSNSRCRPVECFATPRSSPLNIHIMSRPPAPDLTADRTVDAVMALGERIEHRRSHLNIHRSRTDFKWPRNFRVHILESSPRRRSWTDNRTGPTPESRSCEVRIGSRLRKRLGDQLQRTDQRRLAAKALLCKWQRPPNPRKLIPTSDSFDELRCSSSNFGSP